MLFCVPQRIQRSVITDLDLQLSRIHYWKVISSLQRVWIKYFGIQDSQNLIGFRELTSHCGWGFSCYLCLPQHPCIPAPHLLGVVYHFVENSVVFTFLWLCKYYSWMTNPSVRWLSFFLFSLWLIIFLFFQLFGFLCHQVAVRITNFPS